jgi:hypothetical protein
MMIEIYASTVGSGLELTNSAGFEQEFQPRRFVQESIDGRKVF